ISLVHGLGKSAKESICLGRLESWVRAGAAASEGRARSVNDAISLDHLVGQRKQRCRDFETERLRGFEVEDEAKPRRLLERQLRRLRAFENAIYEGGHACKAFALVGAVRHQAAVADVTVVLINSWQPMCGRELEHPFAVENRERIGDHE